MPGITSEPPPSTLAAQIVQNLEDGSSARAHLRELLQMILSGEEADNGFQRAFDDSLEENYRLISVIVKACLEPPSSASTRNEDPFEDSGALRDQARDSLKVIELTIRRSPDVLFVVPETRMPNGSPGGPLFLWLVPHLVNLVSSEDQEIIEGIRSVLHAASRAQQRAAALKFGRRPVLKYIRGCMRDILSYAKACIESNQTTAFIAHLHMPTAETLAETCENRYGLDKTSSVKFKVVSQYFQVVARLCLLLIGPSRINPSVKPLKVTSSDFSWAIDCVSSLWTSFMSFRSFERETLCGLLSVMMESLYLSLKHFSKLKHEAIIASRATQLLCLLIQKALALLVEAQHVALETTICFTLSGLLTIGFRRPELLQIYYEQINTQIEEIVSTETQLDAYSKDVQRSLVLVSQIVNHDSLNVPEELLKFLDSRFRSMFEQLIKDATAAKSNHGHTTERPYKKARTSWVQYPLEQGGFSKDHFDRTMYAMLKVAYDQNHSSLDLAVETFPILDEEEQINLFTALGRAACSSAIGKLEAMMCPDCDGPDSFAEKKSLMDEDLCKDIVSAMSRLLRIAQDQKVPGPRVTAMLSLRRILNHSSSEELLDLRKSALGAWVCASLKSSIRDLRLAAVSNLKLYVRDGEIQQCMETNRPVVLEHLRALAERDEANLHETCILGFGQFLYHVSNEDEVNIALLRLVEYLGNSNPLISGIANDELLKICKYDAVHAQKLFEPYWRSIAVVIVRNFQKRPQIAQCVCDILGIHVSEFLRRTQFYTIPFLVVTRQRDTLQRIATATGPEHSIFSICISRAQLAAILSYLLLHSSGDVVEFVNSLLIEASSEFRDHDLSELLKTNCIYTAFELLKIAGEPDPATKSRAHQIIQFLADTTQRKLGSSRASSGRRQDVMASFFETWALAIVQLLSEVISQAKGSQPLNERRRCVGAIQEMAILAKNQLCHTLPQICSCLRSAIEDKKLCNEALSAWMTLLKTLDEEYITDLVDPTFAILAEHWNSFSENTQQEAYDIIEMLFKHHKELVQKIIETIPSITSIGLLSKFAKDIESFRTRMEPKRQLQAFTERCQSENDTVVLRALNELEDFLALNQSFLQTTANSEQPDPILGEITRAILDACVRCKDSSSSIALRCARCLGLLGCIDPARVEAPREDPEMFVLSNFVGSGETIDFVVFFLREVLVKAYISTTITSRQQLLAFGMQELLRVCDFDASVTFKRDADQLHIYKKWISLPESTRNILTPFLSSKYLINPMAPQPERTYPLYSSGVDPAYWLRIFTLDLLQKGRGQNACLVFDICKRLVRNQDIAIASFLLPYVILNVIVEGTDQQRAEIVRELYTVLAQPLLELNQTSREGLLMCSQNVFRSIDYISRWIQEKEKSILKSQTRERRQEEKKVNMARNSVRQIPPKVISRRAIECKSFARALFHWEEYIREQEEKGEETNDLYEELQEIYMQIDEPDGIEGISSCIHGLNLEQQILEDRKAGRWMAVQNWYEVELEKRPHDVDVQWNLLTSLKESGQYDLLLNQVANFKSPELTAFTWHPFAMEASWATCNWESLKQINQNVSEPEYSNFHVGIGAAIALLNDKNYDSAHTMIERLLLDGTRTLTADNTSSIQACHETLLKFHVLIELEAISEVGDIESLKKSSVTASLDQRLELIGAFSSSKQYLLSVRRAAMELSKSGPSVSDISSTWVTSAKLARKANYLHQAFNAVLHASQLSDTSATIEHARLTWHQGYHRKAIQSLRGALDGNAFQSEDTMDVDTTSVRHSKPTSNRGNMVAARAQLLLAKWMDGAGQTQSTEIVKHYRKVTEIQSRWDKGHYYLGKHYNKLIESEKSNPINKQGKTYLEGELTKLCIENFLRSLPWGSKNIYQALPKVLTLWLDFGAEVEQRVPEDVPKNLNPSAIFLQRKKVFGLVQKQVQKYIDRLPAYLFYTAFAQIVARICHPNKDVYRLLVEIVSKVVASHPQQAIWPLLAMINSKSSRDRVERGIDCKAKILEHAKKTSGETGRAEISNLLNEGLVLAKQLLLVCNKTFDGTHAPRGPLSLSKDIGFNHSKAAPCRLVIPIEAALLANLPPATEGVRGHKAFSKDAITVAVFLDEFTVLNSLIRPRKIKIRGSDGNVYAIMCKPKDDLRKDQRLLEFNSMISRTLKKDAECSKRRLYIRTYAVTPLNEDHGLIEWVEGLRTLRDIFLESYKEKGIVIDYAAIRNQLNVVSSDESQLDIFKRDILGLFRPVLHEWFVKQFPEPSAWLAARLRYTRSCAVMSIVGHVLGLGDRHGENILLEEAQGGTFHVDFNCLFDKGKTFETPERVPFRLTHNMVDAFGVYKENGPFRKSCELTLGILRQYEDTLMTIMETFLYDPTTDFIGKKKRSYNPEVPDTPEGVLDGIRRKVRGLPHGESVPLSEEGYVQLQIDQARDPWNLARMYIGWCPFF